MPLKIAISGSTGLVGSALVSHFQSKGHHVRRIIRKKTKYAGDDPCIVMDVPAGLIEADKLEGQDVVIHLAGAGIAEHKWTPAYKRVLYSSRINTTKLLASALAELKNKPKVFLSASAIGYYGSHQPENMLDERSPLGSDYLAQICQHWEAAAQEAGEAGIRTVLMRTGVVLSAKGGALAKMLPVFRLGLGGKLGSGKQMMSWIASAEIAGIIEHIIDNDAISGPVNFVSPQPLSNEDFTKILAVVLKKPAVLPAPAFALKLLLGEMGETLLLGGARVSPKRLQDTGYQFQYPDLNSALTAALER